MKNSILIWLLFLVNVYAQSDTSFTIDLFNIQIKENKLEVKNPAEKVIFTKTFNSISFVTSDLDNDGIDELIITDSYLKNDKKEFTLYLFGTMDGFYEAGIVNSGFLEPYIQHSDETSTDIIITGDAKFDFLNENSADVYYPLMCWKYEDGELSIGNNELYEIFINENDALTDYIDNFLQSNTKNCAATLQLKNAIAAVYINYLSAGELIMAQQFIKNYYFCQDSDAFKSNLDDLIKKEK